MSIPVGLPELAAKISEFGWAYLLTVRDDGRPHVVAVSPTWDGDVLTMEAGRTTVANAWARPSISLCYPPTEADGYSLIVDGQSRGTADAAVRFDPTTAVLHRPAPSGFESSADGCGSDCLPVDSSES